MELTLKQIEEMEKVDDLMLNSNETNRDENAQKASEILFKLGLIKRENGESAVRFYQKYAFDKISALAKAHTEKR